MRTVRIEMTHFRDGPARIVVVGYTAPLDSGSPTGV